ncbi:MAG: VOC family protein [Candidatus Sulfotelmatobacter sp.]
MIIGAHLLLYSKDPDADRKFFREVLDFPAVDAGEGWLIFGLPPAEAGIHPVDEKFPRDRSGEQLLGAALYLMCDDLDGTMTSFQSKNVQCAEVQATGWGRMTTIPLPSGGKIGLYQPRHATALNLKQ